MVIIYPNDSARGYAIVTPTGEMPVGVVAFKDVPAGVPFLLVEGAIPAEPDFSKPNGLGLGSEGWHALMEQVESALLVEPDAPT